MENRYLYGPAVDQFFAGDVLWALTDSQGTVRDLMEYDALSQSAPFCLSDQWRSVFPISVSGAPPALRSRNSALRTPLARNHPRFGCNALRVNSHASGPEPRDQPAGQRSAARRLPAPFADPRH